MRRTVVILTTLFVSLSLRVSAQNWLGYRIDTVAGSSVNGDGGPATAALLMQAQGIAFDSQHRLYIADAIDSRVRRIGPTGNIETVVGTGVAGFSGDGGQALYAQLRNPYGIVIDSNDNLYIADLGNSRVRMVTPSGQISTLAGGGLTVPGGNSDGSPGNQYVLGAPRNLAVDLHGTLFISDFMQNRVYQVTTDGKLSTVAGSGPAGYSGDYGPAPAAKLNAPAGLTFLADGSLLICDSGNKVVRRVINQEIQTFLPSNILTTTLSSPTSLAYLPSGILLIADPGAGVVFSVTLQTGSVTNLPWATDLTTDSDQNIYLSQQGFVTEISSSGQQTILAGSSNTGFYGEHVPAKNARLYQPTGITADARGNIFIADRQNNRIRRIDAHGGITTFAGTGTPGYSGDGGPASQAQFNRPSSVAFDAFGNLLIADTGNNVIRNISPVGTVWTIAGTGAPGLANDGDRAASSPLNAPEYVFPSQQNVYISDTGNHSVRMVDPQGLIHRIAGSDKPGDSGDGLFATSAQLQAPRGLLVDSKGLLYIADEGAGVVRVMTTFGTISTITTPATGPWISPAGLAMLPDGTLLISDFGTQEVRALYPDGSAGALAGNGSAGFSGDLGYASLAQLDAPTSLFVMPDHSILFADTANNRIRQLSLKPVAITRNSPAVLVVNDASGFPGAVSPGEIVDVVGAVLADQQQQKADPTAPNLPLALGNSIVLINGRPAPLQLAGNGEIKLQIPYELAGSQSAVLQVLYKGALASTVNLTIAASSPGLYLSQTLYQVRANLEDGSLNSSLNPAAAGSSVTVFITGAGLTSGTNVTGAQATAASTPIQAVSATLSSEPVQIASVNQVIGNEGLFAVKFSIPPDMTTGKHALHLTVGSAHTQSGLVLWVKAPTAPQSTLLFTPRLFHGFRIFGPAAKPVRSRVFTHAVRDGN